MNKMSHAYMIDGLTRKGPEKTGERDGVRERERERERKGANHMDSWQ